MTVLGRWLCSRDRHRLVWAPDPPPGGLVRGTGIPDHSYLLPLDPDGFVVPVTTLMTGGTTYRLVQQTPRCARCKTPLDARESHRMGWSA